MRSLDVARVGERHADESVLAVLLDAQREHTAYGERPVEVGGRSGAAIDIGLGVSRFESGHPLPRLPSIVRAGRARDELLPPAGLGFCRINSRAAAASARGAAPPARRPPSGGPPRRTGGRWIAS